MSWSEIRGHEAPLSQFRRAVNRGRLASTFLFVGPSGIGKRTFALKLAQGLLCTNGPNAELEPCGQCPSCQQVVAGSHPDLVTIAKPADKNFLPIELFIGDREHRMREGLCHDIALKPYCGGRKVALIDDADFLNIEGANCLLKTLEEPPPKSLIILIGTSEQKQLPTIRSRCQIIRFQPLARHEVVELLLAAGHAENREQAESWAELGEGSLTRALELGSADMGALRDRLLRGLSSIERSGTELARDIASYLDEAGKKDTSARRVRLRRVIHLAAGYFRHLMLELMHAEASADASLQAAVRASASNWRGSPETAAACLERCLDAEGHVAANASPAIVLDSWLDDLSRTARLAG